MGNTARIIDLDEFRRRREEATAPVAAPSPPPVVWVWWVWSPHHATWIGYRSI